MKEDNVDLLFQLVGLILLALLACAFAFKMAFWAGIVVVIFIVFYIFMMLGMV